MRSLLAVLVPVLALSFGAIACGESELEPQPPVDEQQQQQQAAPQAPAAPKLATEGEACATNDDCEADLGCAIFATNGGTLGPRGLPCNETCDQPEPPQPPPATPAPTRTPAPAPKPKPLPRGTCTR